MGALRSNTWTGGGHCITIVTKKEAEEREKARDERLRIQRQEGRKKFISSPTGGGEVTQREFDIERGKVSSTPEEREALRLKLGRTTPSEKISQDPSLVGLTPQKGGVAQPEGIEVQTEKVPQVAPPAAEGVVLGQDMIFTDDAGVQTTIPAGTPLASLPPGLTAGLTPTTPEEQVLGAAALAGTAGAAIGIGGAVARAATTSWKVGKNIFSNPAVAVQAGNSAKTAKSAKSPLKSLKNWGALAAGFIGFKASSILDKTPEQQQALNTLGQITSTVVGDSTTSAGDWRKGLQQLKFIKQEILELETAIKTGSISSAVIKFDGRILDINADVFDQLATVDEGIRDIQSFALEGQFPELSPQEIQEQLRILEEGGFVQPVDLTEARR